VQLDSDQECPLPGDRTVPLARSSAHSRHTSTFETPSKTKSCKASQRLVDVALNCSKFALKRMSLAEILEQLPKLTEEERDELRSRLDEYDPGFLSILQERVRGIESGER
jgi:hypothetical protein